MTLLELAHADPEGFTALVRRLRTLGVVRIDDTGLVLGPEPQHPAERQARTTQPPTATSMLEKIHNTMFAASSVRPPMPEPSASTANVPRAVVQRRARNEGTRDGGEKRSEG